MRLPTLVLILVAPVAVAAAAAGGAGDTVDGLIRDYLASRGASAQLAPSRQLARRMAIDLTGVVPSAADLAACEGKSPGEIFDHFVAKPAMAHSRGLRPYVWAQLLRDADDFLLSNSSQFSQVGFVRELEGRLAQVYAAGGNYRDFARWALTSQYFLARFPSPADRANAAFFIFLGRDSLASEVPIGQMWNGYRLRNASIPATQAETNADYHVYDYDAQRCSSGQVVCEAQVWAKIGKTPQEATELVVTSQLFAEATVARYWRRLMGRPLPGNDFPEIRRALVAGLIARDFDVNWVLREIATSPAYAQEMMFR